MRDTHSSRIWLLDFVLFVTMVLLSVLSTDKQEMLAIFKHNGLPERLLPFVYLVVGVTIIISVVIDSVIMKAMLQTTVGKNVLQNSEIVLMIFIQNFTGLLVERILSAVRLSKDVSAAIFPVFSLLSICMFAMKIAIANVFIQCSTKSDQLEPRKLRAFNIMLITLTLAFEIVGFLF